MWWLLGLLVGGLGVGLLYSGLKGNNVAILGPRAAGKSTFINFLLKGTIPEEYFATVRPENFKGKKFHSKMLT
jgi:predicted AAA+ superfamily ATPase